jgi:hypothetical protein
MFSIVKQLIFKCKFGIINCYEMLRTVSLMQVN